MSTKRRNLSRAAFRNPKDSSGDMALPDPASLQGTCPEEPLASEPSAADSAPSTARPQRLSVRRRSKRLPDSPASPPEASSIDGENASDDSALHSQKNLSPSQCRALESMMCGKTLGDAAQAAGIDRRTLYRWMNEDPNFQAAHNAWQRDTTSATRSSLLALSEPAVRTVAAAIDRGDAKIAMQLLKGLGTLAPHKPGSTDPETVRKSRDVARKREANDLFLDEMAFGGLG